VEKDDTLPPFKGCDEEEYLCAPGFQRENGWCKFSPGEREGALELRCGNAAPVPAVIGLSLGCFKSLVLRPPRSFPAMHLKNPRKYTKYFLRFLIPLTKKSVGRT